MTNIELKEYIRDRLNDLGYDPEKIFEKYAEEHRHYHTLEHIFYILRRMELAEVLEQNVFFLSAIFHDYYYDPTLDVGINEFKSNEYFRQLSRNDDSTLIDSVSTIILESDIRKKPSTEESKLFRKFDLGIFEESFSKLMDSELKIFKEYQHVDWRFYQRKRIEFLKTMDIKAYPIVKQLIDYVLTWKPNIGIYVGTFNPFHQGHMDILQKAEGIFDKVIIAAGINIEKSTQLSTSFPPKKLKYRQTIKFTNILTDLISELGYDVTIIVGMRNVNDFQTNMNSYYFHQDLNPKVKMVALFSDKNLCHVSSTTIRTLHNFDKTPKYEI